MIDYTKIDAAILDAIKRNGPTKLAGIQTFIATSRGPVMQLIREAAPSNHELFRVIDRRLTSMKNAGKIEYKAIANGGPGWGMK